MNVLIRIIAELGSCWIVDACC